MATKCVRHIYLLVTASFIGFVIPSQDKRNYEKIGESTEVALKVLAEKLNVHGLDRGSMTEQQKACASYKAAREEFEKVRYSLDCMNMEDTLTV